MRKPRPRGPVLLRRAGGLTPLPLLLGEDMVEVFIKTLPFFALIAVGYGAGRARFFNEEATAKS